jgi:hypothetical protein
MSGVAYNLDGSAWHRNESGVILISTADNLPAAQPSLLASLRDRHRITRSVICMNMLSITERKQFYNEAVDLVLKYQTGNLSGP